MMIEHSFFQLAIFWSYSNIRPIAIKVNLEELSEKEDFYFAHLHSRCLSCLSAKSIRVNDVFSIAVIVHHCVIT